MTKKSILALTLFLFLFLLCPLTLGFSTSLPRGTEYKPTETIILSITTTLNPEKGDPYIAEWYNSTNSLIQNDSGFLSTTIGGTVFETYITSAVDNWTNAYVNVTVGATTIQKFFNVTGSAANNLVISDAFFSPEAKLGAAFAVDFRVTDKNNKRIDKAECVIFGTDINGGPLQECTADKYTETFNGRGICGGILDPIPFMEGEQYLAKIRCNCGIGEQGCFDEDGNNVTAHKGSATFVFTVDNWLTVNTITDRNNYSVDDIIYVCANVTNNNSERIPILVSYNWRCENGGGDLSTDRILLGDKIEERGVSANTTQNQCNSFLVADDITIETGAVNCYAATTVTVLNKNKEKVFTYDTKSPLFTIMVDEVNPFVRWITTGINQFSGVVNLSIYDVGVKDVDVRVNPRLTTDGTPTTAIKDYTVTYLNGSAIPYSTEIQTVKTAVTDNSVYDLNINKYDELTITIKGVNTTLDEVFNVTITRLATPLNSEDANMLSLIITSLLIITIYLVLGYFNFKYKAMNVDSKSHWVYSGCFAMAFLQVFYALGLATAGYLNYDITALLRINIYVNFFALMIFAFVTLIYSLGSIIASDEDTFK